MDIAVLIENTTRGGTLAAEFGLSLYIDALGHKILFDMGASGKFIHNAMALDIDLQAVDTAVLSHAHRDHGGGLGAFLDLNADARVYTGPETDGDYFGDIRCKLPLALHPLINPWLRSRRLLARAIGLDKTVLHKHADRIDVLKADTRIHNHISLLVSILKRYPLAEGNKFLHKVDGRRLHPDDFAHEAVMVVQEPDGLVVVTGCGHRGILNMVDTVRAAFAGRTIKGVVGGFHLALQPGKPAAAGSREEIQAIADALMASGVQRVCTGHCTGEEAYAVLHQRLGGRLERLYTGARINL